MKPTNRHIILLIFWLLSARFLTACSEPTEKVQAVAQATKTPGEIYLATDSPKKAYVKTTTLSLSKHPLLEPLAGKIAYNENLTSRVSSPVAGRVVSTPVTLGAQVQIGATLLEMNSPDVADAEADFAKAQADSTLANHAFTRQQELYAGKAVSRKELEQTQDELSRARSDLQRAQQRLKNLHIATLQNDGHFALRSPIAGTVVERNITPGMEVRPDLEKPLFVISNIKTLTVLMNVFEVNLAKIKLGQKLLVSVPAYPNEKFSATVQYIGQVMDEQTRTVQVRCELPNPDARLLPGMYATINVESNPNDLAVVIPLTAIYTEDDNDYVFVKVDNDHYRQRAIKIGLRLNNNAVVIDGLHADEQLVTEGALMLRAEEEVETDSSKSE